MENEVLTLSHLIVAGWSAVRRIQKQPLGLVRKVPCLEMPVVALEWDQRVYM